MLTDGLSSLRPLGQGAYARVRLVKHTDTGELLAIKTVRIREGSFQQEETQQIEVECQIHRQLSHPNIIKLHDFSKEGSSVELLMEYADLGDCAKLLREKKRLSESEALRIVFQVCKGLDYLHQMGIIHRDIKLENVLRLSNGLFKICDFGWCSPPSDSRRNVRCGTYEYMAPEVVSQKNYSTKIDMWSLGVLAFELVHGTTPFRAPDPPRIMKNINSGEFDIDHIVSPEYRTLIQNLIHWDPNRRFSTKQLLQMSMFREISKEYESTLSQKTRMERQLYAQKSREIEDRDWNRHPGCFQIAQEGFGQEERPIDKLMRKFELLEQERLYNAPADNFSTQMHSNREWSNMSESSKSKLGLVYTPVISAKPRPDEMVAAPGVDRMRQNNQGQFTLFDKERFVEVNPDINQSHFVWNEEAYHQPQLQEAPGTPGIFDTIVDFIKGWVDDFGRSNPHGNQENEPEIKMRTIHNAQPANLGISQFDPKVSGVTAAVPLKPYYSIPQKKTTRKYHLLLSGGGANYPVQDDFEFG